MKDAIKSCFVRDEMKASRNRHSGAGFKLPIGAAVKSCGIERNRKRLMNQSSACQEAE